MRIQIFIITLVFGMLGCDGPTQLGNGYIVTNYDGGYYVVADSKDMFRVNSHVSKYAFTDRYIIAEQKIVDSISKPPTIHEANKRIEESDIAQYWIIDKSGNRDWNSQLRRASNVLGPFDEEELFRKFDSLGIPDSVWSDSSVHRTKLETKTNYILIWIQIVLIVSALVFWGIKKRKKKIIQEEDSSSK